ncbi:MAG TPA: response regulator [Prolixibacteraceae bacterium]|nr:response regulator [Prolixibacteraceae bacterium]
MDDLRPILLAEDNPKDVELTLEALSEYNLANKVVVVRDGVEALEFLRYEGQFKLRNQGNPAVLLLDIKMPRMGGIELLQVIRNDPALKYLPIVMLTSSREESDLVTSYELGANAFVVKPIDFEHFMDVIKQIGVFWALINELPPEK